MPKLEIPTWEASKEIADQLPGDDDRPDKCPECGTDLDPRDQKDQKGRR